ncbi:hypothetical protein F52700_8600 [Fusarium sp. NRRL 52700]|nr:hypothetical protein F52700_8600 [Fusarium sp. NRRL 52700]
MRPQTTLALWAFLIPLCLAVSCNQLSNPYDGPSNKQFEIVCNSYSTGGNQVGSSFEVTDLETCIQLCGDDATCKVALLDKSQLLCYLMDESDGPAPNNLYDMAVLLSPAPTTTTTDAISTTTEAVSATTSAASGPISCEQLDSPSFVDGVEFNTNCGWRATGSIPMEYHSQVHSMTECMAFCADNLACRVLNFYHNSNECYLYESFSGLNQDTEQDMAYVVSRPAVSSTTEAPTELSTTTSLATTSIAASSTTEAPTELSTTTSLATTSTTAAPGPLSCSQMAGSPYTGPHGNKFAISCDTSSTGESIYKRDEEDTLQGCLDRCDKDNRCIAVNFLPPPYSECDLIESFAGTQISPGADFASKILSSSTILASSDTSTSIEPTTEATESTIYTSSSASVSSESQETSSALTSETTTAGTIESSSFTTTSDVTSEATTSLPMTSSLFTSLSSSEDTTSGTYSVSTLQSTQESTSASAASATTSLEVISSSTELSASTSTELSSLSSESISESTTDVQTVSTSADESASLEPTTVATSTGSLDTDTSSIEMSTAETLTTERTSVETSAITNSATAIKSTSTGSGSSDTSRFSTEIQSTSDASALPSSSESSGPSPSQTNSSSSFSYFTTTNIGSKTLSASESTITETKSETRLPASLPTPTAIHTAYSTLTIDHAYIKTRFAETVTTVTYTTVNPTNPASLITTCVPITMLYSPCGCKNQVYPTVDMTTVACTQGGDIVTLTVPKAACETGRGTNTRPIVQYPSGWVGGHQTDAGGNSYPTGRPTGGSQPGSKNGQPEYSAVAPGPQDSHPSYETNQPVAPTSVGGSKGAGQPKQGNPQPSVAAQGSAESNDTPVKPSQPSSPKSLTTETRIIPTSQLGNSALPSQSLPVDKGQAPSKSKGEPYATSVVVSEAHRYDLTSWTVITALVGMLLL